MEARALIQTKGMRIARVTCGREIFIKSNEETENQAEGSFPSKLNWTFKSWQRREVKYVRMRCWGVIKCCAGFSWVGKRCMKIEKNFQTDKSFCLRIQK